MIITLRFAPARFPQLGSKRHDATLVSPDNGRVNYFGCAQWRIRHLFQCLFKLKVNFIIFVIIVLIPVVYFANNPQGTPAATTFGGMSFMTTLPGQ